MRRPNKPSRSCDSTVGLREVASAKQQSAPQRPDNWGYEVTAKPPLDAAAKTKLGTLRPFVELMIELDAGDFNDSPGAVPARPANRKPDTAARDKSSGSPLPSGSAPAAAHADRPAIARKLK
jgi:hypothetical protein